MKSDRDKGGLVGIARTVRIKIADIVKQNGSYTEEPRLLQTIIYNEAGSRVGDAYYNADGSLQHRTSSTYTDTGELAEESRYKADGSLSSKTVYTFSKEGRLAEKITRGPDGAPTEKVILAYDSAGRRSEELPVEGDAGSSYVIEGTIYHVQDARMLKLVYDDAENLIEVHFYNIDNSLISKIIFIYSYEGRLVEDAQYACEGSSAGAEFNPAGMSAVGIPLFRRVYVYNAVGLKTEEKVYSAGSATRKVFTYDSGGVKIEEAEYEADNSIKSRLSFSYELNHQGDWVKETVAYWSPAAAKFEPTTVTYRTITYY